MSSLARVLAGVCLVSVLVSGCGGDPPAKEIQLAERALETAAAAGAATYASEEFLAAQQAMGNAKTAVDQRDYRLALNHALDSRERAQNAEREAVDGKATAKQAAERALTDADAAFTSAREKLKSADDRKLPARLLSAPRTGIDTAAERLQEARAAFDQERFLDVPEKAKAASALLTAPLEQLDAALTAPVRRRR